MFNDELARAIIAAAQKNDIDPAGLLAIVEVETAGKTFEQDGRTPQFLFERHICYREARKMGDHILNRFIKAGLAIPKWSRSTQYKDQNTSAKRLDLIRRAREINAECANRSASWGVGQTMGFLAEELGFENANAMVAYQTGNVDGQIDCMIKELRKSGLIRALNAGDWARVARVYNGSGYAANQYDTRLADARARWARKLPQIRGKNHEPPPEQTLSRDEIEEIQQKLKELGFPEVGMADGRWGTKTTGAIAAFQAHEGLKVTGHYDDETRKVLEAAVVPKEPDIARAEATADDLREQGSETIKQADNLSALGTVGKAAGGVVAGGAAAEQVGLLGDASGALDHLQDVGDKVDQAKGLWESVHDFIAPVTKDPKMLFIGLAIFLICWAVGCVARRIIARRVEDHRQGINNGPSGE